mmetsp:Transcript_19718/g.54762  ORF Transcript_19718/g.54762 Transcript_19718/m.54762 type:complete len:421 (-) Transcript_19718:153-1415(-)
MAIAARNALCPSLYQARRARNLAVRSGCTLSLPGPTLLHQPCAVLRRQSSTTPPRPSITVASAEPASSGGGKEEATVDLSLKDISGDPSSSSVGSSGSEALAVQENGGGGNNGNSGSGGGGGGGGGGNGDSEDEDKLLTLAQAEEVVAAKGLELPADFAAAAAGTGLRLSALDKWIALQGVWLYALFSRLTPIFRDRLIADDRFLFKVMAEIIIDSGCATAAEVRKRGDEFWDEFEFYLSDMLVGIVMDVFIMTAISPVAVIGKEAKKAKASGLAKLTAGFPSAVFEKSIPGVREYSVGQRMGSFVETAVQYGMAGLISGIIGQAIANQLMLLKRRVHGTSENDVPIPPIGLTGVTWGVFMAGSSNVRYQTVFGLERLMDISPIGSNRKLTNVLSVGIRYINNFIGGENFIDHARFFGCQ